MRKLIIPGFLALAGCGDVSTLADCLGQLNGAYEGAMEGSLDAELAEDGTLTVVFYGPDGEILEQGSGSVSEDGVVDGSAGDLDFGGTFDFDSCSATGDWLSNAAEGGEGTWDLGGFLSE